MKTLIFKENIASVAAVFWRLDCDIQNNTTVVLELYTFIWNLFSRKRALRTWNKIQKITKFVIFEDKTNKGSTYNDWNAKNSICATAYWSLILPIGLRQPQISNTNNWVKFGHHGLNLNLQQHIWHSHSVHSYPLLLLILSSNSEVCPSLTGYFFEFLTGCILWAIL